MPGAAAAVDLGFVEWSFCSLLQDKCGSLRAQIRAVSCSRSTCTAQSWSKRSDRAESGNPHAPEPCNAIATAKQAHLQGLVSGKINISCHPCNIYNILQPAGEWSAQRSVLSEARPHFPSLKSLASTDAPAAILQREYVDSKSKTAVLLGALG